MKTISDSFYKMPNKVLLDTGLSSIGKLILCLAAGLSGKDGYVTLSFNEIVNREEQRTVKEDIEYTK